VNLSLAAILHEDQESFEQDRCAINNALSGYFSPRGCWTKNSHITPEALISRVVRPTIHSGKGLPPGQAWPPPSTVLRITSALLAQFV
jgi:hypothetical protein